jgi:xylulokinase
MPQCEEITEVFGGDRVRRVTGWKPHVFLAWPKILWLMHEQPDLADQARWLTGVNGYIRHRLCGELVLDRSNALGLPRSIRDMSWDQEMRTWRDFPTEKVPRLVPCTRVVGSVSYHAAEMSGLPVGLPVVAGGIDTVCAAFAVGAFRPGRTFEVSGTSGGVGFIASTPSEEPALGVAPHLLPNLFANLAPMSAAGASFRWAVQNLCRQELEEAREADISPYSLVEEEVSGLPPGPTGLVFLPYLEGERAPVWDGKARGVLLGLTLSTSRAEILKAIMEGTGYALRQNLMIARDSGQEIGAIRSCGGGSRSRTWSQLKSDMTDRPIVVFRPERDAAFGAALLAGIANQAWNLNDIDEAIDREDPEIYIPEEDVSRSYRRFQSPYEEAYSHLRDLLPAP